MERERKDPRTAWFAGRLQELREAAALSREQLAERAGMKVGGIRDLEQGRRDPSWDTVLALAQALGVTCEAFTVQPSLAAEARKPGRPRKPNANENTALDPQRPPSELRAQSKESSRSRKGGK